MRRVLRIEIGYCAFMTQEQYALYTVYTVYSHSLEPKQCAHALSNVELKLKMRHVLRFELKDSFHESAA